MPIHVEIVTQEKKIFDEPEADRVRIPAAEGEMGVLPNHAPVLTTLGFGELIVYKGNAEEHFAIYGGVVDVRPDKVMVLADMAEASFDIDQEALRQARERAAKMLEDGVPAAQNREATLALRRAEIGLRIKNKMSNSGPVMRIVEQEDEG